MSIRRKAMKWDFSAFCVAKREVRNSPSANSLDRKAMPFNDVIGASGVCFVGL